MSDDLEKEIALYEAERNRAWHSWFAARGHIPPTDESTLIFDGGFRMAWELCRAKPAPQPAEQKPAPDVTQLVEARELLLIFRGVIGGATWTLDDEDKELAVRVEKAVTALATHKDSLTVQPNPPDVAGLVEALEEGLRAIGDHHAPGDCYATGPMTGDPFRDLVQCPACSFIAMCDDLLAAYRKGGKA